MDAMVKRPFIAQPWLEQPELGKALKQALAERDMGTTEVAEAILERYGQVSSAVDPKGSIRSTLSQIAAWADFTRKEYLAASNVREGSSFLFYAEQILDWPLNSSGRVHNATGVAAKAEKARARILKKAQPKVKKKSNVVSLETHREHNVGNTTHNVDTDWIEAQQSPREQRVFATILGPGGTMQQIEKEASIGAQVPESLRGIPDVFGMQVSGNAMAPWIKHGTIVWMDYRELEIDSPVLLIPRDVSDVRRYVCRLTQITEAFFIATQISPPAFFTGEFAKSAWQCFMIAAQELAKQALVT